MAALGARPRRVARVHRHDGHACQRRLVGQERDQLEERPAGKFVASVSAPNREPVANSAEILNGDSPSGVFGSLDDRFADDVVLPEPFSPIIRIRPGSLRFNAAASPPNNAVNSS